MKLVNIDGMPNFEVKTEDGKEYVLLPFKHLYDIPTVPAIPLDKVKQAKEEIENEIKFWSEPPKAKLLPSVKAVKAGKANSYKHCLEILDKLLESEE
jgi:hypothetical protein